MVSRSGLKHEEEDNARENGQNDIVENTVPDNKGPNTTLSKQSSPTGSNANIQTQDDNVSLNVEERRTKIKMRRENLIKLLQTRQEWVNDIANDLYCKKIKKEIDILDEEELQLILLT